MIDFVFGAIAVSCLVISAFFFQFYLKLKDRFFCFFALAFGIFALERLVLLFVEEQAASYAPIYLIRLTGFGLILIAIYDKNRMVGKS